MHQLSRQVSSNQPGLHPRLDKVVDRHLKHPWKKPVHPANVAAFRQVRDWVDQRDQPMVLDSGCGTGASTIRLAESMPDHSVIGVDKSAHRLARSPGPLPPNARLIRAELGDFWCLAAESGWRLAAHWLLYPNPWPKSAHLKRRWHGHPAFPRLLMLGGNLVLRSNWRLYLEEFSRALVVAGRQPGVIMPVDGVEPLTPFESKYASSQHGLFELIVELEE